MARLKVRARAVDMLGRQQIAGIPTAIHELYKNAHDAYAERAEVDYFRRTRVLILRDDGIGMTRQDVDSRWLTLGTDSRLRTSRSNPDDEWTGPRNLPRRALMGEKGIGRLAIAVVAPITLLLTRAVRPDGLHDLVVVLVHWGLFEQPGLDISDIDVPILELPGGSLPTRNDVTGLVERVQRNIETIADRLTPEALETLLDELGAARGLAPDRLDATLVAQERKKEGRLSLLGDGYGTHFILLPTMPELNDDLDGGSDKDASILEKNLLGFSNTMTGEVPVLRTEFRDRKLDDDPVERIGPNNFFLPDEFERADHRIVGDFDEFGQFNGKVRIYGAEPVPFVCNWAEGAGRRARCGRFSLDFAYAMGLRDETKMPESEWSAFNRKVDRIGGLYIYRNGIRVLPYGNSDFDFLDIEIRRTKSASDWFFSYRRIFGFVAISNTANHTLSEKAGREGFRQNRAYRDFRAILINLFQRLAFEFFRPTATQSEAYWEKKTELKAQALLLAKQQKKADNRRKRFADELNAFFERFETAQFEATAESIRLYVDRHTQELELLPDEGDLAVELRGLQREVAARIAALDSLTQVGRPRGLALTKKLEKDWAAYQRTAERVQKEIVTPLRKDVEELIQSRISDRFSATQYRETALEILTEQRDQLVREFSQLRSSVYNSTETMLKTVKEVVREEFTEFRLSTERILDEFTRASALEPGQLNVLRQSSERNIQTLRAEEIALLEAIQRQLEDFSEALRERVTTSDHVGALDQRLERLEEQLEFSLEFAQIGMSVGILQHEFEHAATTMRTAMSDLGPWAKGTPALAAIYQRLRESFEHLDGYMSVLAPLARRLRRAKVSLSGDEIRNYLNRVFSLKLEENRIKITATDAFLKKRTDCFSSTILAAFVNIVDNAVYWISNGAAGPGEIVLDVDDRGYLISNSGPGIEERHKERIFDFGETTKPGGRGMGLAIARQSLERDGFGLELIRAGSGQSPVFRIDTAADDINRGGDHDNF